MAGKPSYAELEQRVRELEDRCYLLSVNMDSLFMKAPVGIALFDRECRNVNISKALADFSGCSVADHLGRQLHDVLPAPAAAEIEADLRGVLATGEAACNKEISIELQGPLGKMSHWLYSQFPVYDGKGNIVGVGVIVTEITEVKRLRTEVFQKELFLRLLLENLPEKIFVKDAGSRYLYCNANFALDLGIASDEIAGKRDENFFPVAISERCRADDQRIMASGKTEEREEVCHVRGEERTMHMVKAPVVSGQGEPIGLICISRDITNCKLAEAELAQYQVELKNRIAEQTRELEEKVFNLVESHEKQKQTEVELRESEERFRQIAENINSFFWIRDLPAGQILYVSPAYEKIWGRPCESLYKNPESWLEAVHPEDREWVLARHFPRKTPEQGLEFRIIGKGGIICWIRSKVFMVCDQSGRNYREVGVAEDITTYMEILARWQESESRYRTFFETSTDGVSICTGKKLVDCNASFMRLSGYDKVELLDLADISTIMNFINKQTGDERRSPSLDIIRENGRCGGLYSWLRPDGRTNFIECRGNRLIVNGTDLMHCVHRDMTQVKLAEEKIRHLSRRIIESTEEEQKRIARDLHDEFGQRLLSMRHKVDALQKKLVFAGKPELLELTEIGELIETIGSVVRGVTTRLRPDMLDTLGFLSTLQWGMQDFAERYPMIRTSMEIVGAEKEILPEYETALYRVFQEGLVNIAKHAEACTVTARLIFSYPSCFLTLADDGRGFELDPLSGAALKNNAGLGLRSMQERMLAIGGTFVIRSRPGEGTLLRAEVCQPVPPPEALPLFMMPGRKRS